MILSTFQRPEHLRRSLRSLAAQQGVDGLFEVVVTDDGSVDETAGVVRRFAQAVDFPVTFTTHEHREFRLARCRNEGTRASSTPYLLFSDGDCIFPRDHLKQHLRARRPGVARSGSCLLLSEDVSRRVDDVAIESGAYESWAPRWQHWLMYQRWIKDQFYGAIGHSKKPKLIGCNIGVWRRDLQRVNGFDECFVGWGCEDDDLAERLRRAGVRIASILGYTYAYHLWHPVHATVPADWRNGANVRYYERPNKPARCVNGLTKPERGESDDTPPELPTQTWKWRPAA